MNQQASHLNPVAMGKRLKLARKNKLLTQDELSEKVGITLNFYGMIERGEKGLSLDTLVNLCNVLGESIDYVVTGKITAANETQMIRDYNSLNPIQRKAAEEMFEAWIKSIRNLQQL